MRNTRGRHLIAIGVYSVAAILLTWPLVTHFTTHVPGDGIDNPALAWNLWWIKARLVDQLNPDIFSVNWMFHPININLAFYTLTPLNGLLSIPLQTSLQLVIANNLISLSSFILGGYGTFLLALYIQGMPPIVNKNASGNKTSAPNETVATLVALVAGLVYAFASAKLFYAALGQFNIISSQWIPFAILYIVRLGFCTSTRTSIRTGALAALFMTLQAWSELTYASFLIIFFALFCSWWAFIVLSDRLHHKAFTTSLAPARVFFSGMAVAATVFILGLLPFLVAMIPDMVREGDFFASGGGFADVFSADLVGYLTPTQLHPIVGDLVAQLPFAKDKGQHIYLGYILLLLSALGIYGYGIRSSPEDDRTKGANLIWFWLLAAIAFWLLTLGPHPRWAGNDLPIPGPFLAISKLPFFSGNRYPSRYSVMLLLSAAMLAVYGLRCLADLIRQARPSTAKSERTTIVVMGALAALIVVEHLSVPLPLTDFQVPAIYNILAADSGDYTILELPTGWRNGARVLGKSDILIMMQQWYQTAHGKRRLGGNTSRNPPLKFQYFTEAPLINNLIALMNADREHIAAVVEPNLQAMIDRDSEIAPDVLDFLGAEFVLLYVEYSPDALLRFVEETLPVDLIETWQGTNWSGDPSTIKLYKTRERDRVNGWELNLADEAGRLHMAEGWSTLNSDHSPYRFATRPQSTLLLDLPAQGGSLGLELAGIADSVDLVLNGHPLPARTAENPSWIEAEIPPGVAAEIVDRLTLSWHGEPQSITQIDLAAGDSNRQIGETGQALPHDVTLAVRSAGEEVGDFAHIYVNGVDHALGVRGYNLVAISSQGEILDTQAFDTHASPQASNEMAAWLAQWTVGTIIAGAVADDASLSQNVEAIDALRQIGVSEDLRNKFRWGHAFIGVVGADPATALEEAKLLAPSDVSIGPPIDAATTTGGVGRIRFSAAR